MGLYDDAVKDVKELKETAMERAKNVLLEAMVPKMKEAVEKQLVGESDDVTLEMDAADEQVDETVEKEAVEQETLELEAKKKDEDEEDEEVVDENAQVDEVVEVNESDLVEALAEALKEVKTRMTSEAKVSKSFGPPGDATLKASGGKAEKGLADEKNGEHWWNDEKPPAAKDWTVREQKLIRYVKNINEQLKKYKGAYGKLAENLKEVNLFNAKLLYTNKVLQTEGLSNKSKLAIVEQFDEAQSRKDVELIYNTFSKSFDIAGVMGESVSRKLQRGSRPTPPSSTVLKEQMKRESQQVSDEDREETLNERWERLSGVSEILKD